MQVIIRIIGFFIGLFIVANGVWIILTPPYGDEPWGFIIIIAGILIPAVVQVIAQADDKREA